MEFNSTDLSLAARLDSEDELAGFRSEFVIADPDLIYLDGNSLGRLPRRTPQVMQDVIQRQWGDRLIRSWNEGWMDAPALPGPKSPAWSAPNRMRFW